MQRRAPCKQTSTAIIERLTTFVTPPERRALLEDIAYYRRRIRAAGPADSAAARAARDAYLPFIERRLQLLAALADGHAHDWRSYPVEAGVSALAESRSRENTTPSR